MSDLKWRHFCGETILGCVRFLLVTTTPAPACHARAVHIRGRRSGKRRAREAAEFLAKIADFGVAVLHGRLGEADLRLGDPKFLATLAAARRLQPRHRALADQLPFELRQGREDPKDQLAARSRGVDVGALSSQHLEANSAFGKVLSRIHQMFEIASQSVELPDHKRIVFAQRPQAGGEGRAVVAFAGGHVFVEVVQLDAGSDQGIALQVEHPAAVGFGAAGVSDAHISPRCHSAMRSSRNWRAVIIGMVS